MNQKEQRDIFSKNLKKLINASGKMQREVADDLNIGATTLNNWCAGTAIPSYQKIKSLADYFKVHVTDLTDEYGIDYVLDTPKGRMLIEVEKQAKKMDERQLALLLQYIEVMNYTLNDKKE